jgi:hypothetical protein
MINPIRAGSSALDRWPLQVDDSWTQLVSRILAAPASVVDPVLRPVSKSGLRRSQLLRVDEFRLEIWLWSLLFHNVPIHTLPRSCYLGDFTLSREAQL